MLTGRSNFLLLAFFAAIFVCPLAVSAVANVPGQPEVTYSASNYFLNWTMNENDLDTKYEIYTAGDVLVATDITANIYSLVGQVASGTTYRYKVRAFDGVATSSFSVLSDPFLVPFTPTEPVGVASTSEQIDLIWTANGNAGGTIYGIFDVGDNNHLVGTTTEVAFSVTGLLPDTEYTYKIGVTNSLGTPYIFSTATSTYTFITTPTLVTSSFSTSTLVINWDAVGGLSGQVYGIIYDNDLATTTALTYTLSNLTPDRVVEVDLAAYDHSDELGPRLRISGHTKPLPPVSLSASGVSTSQINLSWSTGGNVDGVVYEVFNNTTNQTVGITTSISYSVTGLAAGMQYTFSVRTKSSNDESIYSGYSAQAAATTQSVSSGGGGGGSGGASAPKPIAKPIVEGSSTVALINSPIVFTLAPTSTPAGKSFLFGYFYTNKTSKREQVRITRQFLDSKGKVVYQYSIFPYVSAGKAYRAGIWQTGSASAKPGIYTVKITVVGKTRYENSFKVQIVKKK